MIAYRVRIELVEIHPDTGAEVILERRTTSHGAESEARRLFDRMYDEGLLKSGAP